jgi:hypothetical protein
MSQSEETKRTDIVENDPREPYERPSIECEELYEVLALTCGKVVPRTTGCKIAANQS